MILEEVAEHANLYLQFLVDSSHDDLRYHMNQYVFNKMYNTDFGNLVPLVIANVLHVKDRAHLSTFKFFILEKFSCIVVLIVFFVIVQSSGLTYVWFREKTTFFLNFISFHIFAIYVGGACWGLPAACGLIAVSGARLPSVDGLTVRYIKNAPLLNMPSKYVCDLFQTCFRYMYVWYKHTGTLPLCLQVALSFIWLD